MDADDQAEIERIQREHAPMFFRSTIVDFKPPTEIAPLFSLPSGRGTFGDMIVKDYATELRLPPVAFEFKETIDYSREVEASLDRWWRSTIGPDGRLR